MPSGRPDVMAKTCRSVADLKRGGSSPAAAPPGTGPGRRPVRGPRASFPIPLPRVGARLRALPGSQLSTMDPVDAVEPDEAVPAAGRAAFAAPGGALAGELLAELLGALTEELDGAPTL